jgi:hypothetical protein
MQQGTRARQGTRAHDIERERRVDFPKAHGLPVGSLRSPLRPPPNPFIMPTAHFHQLLQSLACTQTAAEPS